MTLDELQQAHTKRVNEFIAYHRNRPAYQELDTEGRENYEFAMSRLDSIGGTDVAAILGLSPYKTPFQLWQEKTLRTDFNPTDNVFTHWGRRLEDVIRQEYLDLFEKGMRPLTYHKSPVFFSGHLPFLKCNLDGLWAGAPDNPTRIVHEIKTAATNAYSGDYDKDKRPILSWGDGNIYDMHDDGSFEIVKEDGQVPPVYRIQVETYMMVTGAQAADISVLIGHHDFRNFRVHANPELQKQIREAATEFWEKNVLEDTPPELVAADYEDTRDNGDLRQITPGMLEVFHQLLEVRNLHNAVGRERKALEDKVKAFIGDHAGVCTARGKVLATWKSSAVHKTFNLKKFKEERADLYTQYLEPSTPRRTFLVKE